MVTEPAAVANSCKLFCFRRKSQAVIVTESAVAAAAVLYKNFNVTDYV